MKKKALISVYDKTGIVDFASALKKCDFEIISTGGTALTLNKSGIKCTEISDFTGFPEILDGRVKTLHPKVFGGILFKREDENHNSQVQENKIFPIDLVVVNLYPFLKKVKEDISFEEKLEFIDIGGPSMIRAAAKNFNDVVIVIDPRDYIWITERLINNGEITFDERKKLAMKVFEEMSEYESSIASFLGSEALNINSKEKKNLRYGENPDEQAAIFQLSNSGLASGKVLQGKEMSYNNYLDGDAALSSVKEFEDPACIVVKHRNPCGAAIGEDIFDALKKALETDKKSAFGGIFAINRECDEKIANYLKDFFFEVFLAPSFSKEALKIFSSKKNLRLLELGDIKNIKKEKGYKSVSGGILEKSPGGKIKSSDFQFVTKDKPEKKEIRDLEFAYKVCKHTISNAISVVKNGKTIGICGGQTSRVDAVKIALERAGSEAKGASLASDGFFPFADSVEILAEHGIKSCIAPGGSIRDKEVFSAAEKNGISFVIAPTRVFKH